MHTQSLLETYKVSCQWILHDYLQVNGGAERLVLTVARGLPGFSLGVAGIYPDFASSSSYAGADVHVLGRLPLWVPRVPRALLTFKAHRAEVAQATTVIYSGIYAPLAVSSQKLGRSIYYCHTPPRFAFDRKNEYLDRVPSGARIALGKIIDRYRTAYLEAIGRMDVILANSEHIRMMLSTLGVDADVLYPPIAVDLFKWKDQGDYFLSFARLEPNKRVDRIVKAFLHMPDQRLVVASGGSQLDNLRALARSAPNIKFVGWSNDASLAELIGHARACIYIPLDEDFGMSAVEAMAAGKPVIGVAEGGLRETIVDGSTGFLLPANPGVYEIAASVRALTPSVALAMRHACEERAITFDQSTFLERLKSLL
ncbi:glycosyltransferase [Methylococcus sp. EFPC2]|uniref:glycosyltransferase n=1 Tax=Methylococcus sp. EFPC2 TaxID=2812648 RepID=UPI001967C1C2|nr:glycosyltransferase [Methylococcus sp. EFPC2]QSA96823.1 glycosyltransferase [Methylococcus sp. EFPC2]